jgi:hypothetical protein
VIGGTSAPDRFHSLAWGRNGPSELGLIAGGLTNGVVSVWDASAFQEEKAPVASLAKHAGAVQGLDWNPTMTNLLASCGSDGQLLIWDLANASKPSVYVPGARVKPVSDGMSTVAWNRSASVPHILAGALSGGSCEIWDLKNKKQVIAFHDTKRCNQGGQRSLAWHPTEATMIVQVSDDDLSPVVLVWDLKHYAAPVAVLSGHKRGITSVAWSSDDPSLLVTSSRDGTSLVWDLPNSRIRTHLLNDSSAAAGAAVSATETPFHTQIVFAPLVRGHLATASSDGSVRVHALIDSGPRGRAGNNLGPAPKWLLRPCGASFGFGGRLLRFNSTSRVVKIAAVVTDQELVEAAKLLRQQSASNQELTQLCESKSASSKGDESLVWAQLAQRLKGVARDTALLQFMGISVAAPKEVVNPFDTISSSEWDESSALWGTAEWEENAGRLACAGKVEEAWQVCAGAQQWPTALLVARELGGEEEYTKCRAAWLNSASAPALASGIVKALSTSPEKLILHGPLSEWKSLAAAALSWGADRCGHLLSLLSERLRVHGDLSSSQLCAIGANDFDGLASSWIGGVSVTEAVERLLCASRAFGVDLAPHTSRLAHALSSLADALAAQGDMEGALYWLQQIQSPSTGPPNIRLLYERLCTAKAPLTAKATTVISDATKRSGPASVARPTNVAAPTVTPSFPSVTPAFVSPAPLPFASSHVQFTSGAHNVSPPPVVPVAVPFVRPVVSHQPLPVMPASFSQPVAAAPEEPVISATKAHNGIVSSICNRLSRGAEQLAGNSDQSAKLAEEAVKRIPSLKTKLDSLSPSAAEPVVVKEKCDAKRTATCRKKERKKKFLNFYFFITRCCLKVLRMRWSRLIQRKLRIFMLRLSINITHCLDLPVCLL